MINNKQLTKKTLGRINTWPCNIAIFLPIVISSPRQICGRTEFPKPYRERAPRRVKLPNGNDIIVEEGRPITFRGTNQFAGKSLETFSPVGLDFDHAVGAGPPQQRLKEQDQDGIDAELLFATEARNTAIQDKAALLAIVKAFNDYFIEEYCGVAPDRLVGVAVMPDIGVDEDIVEMRRCKENGFKAVRLHTFPSGKSFPTPEDDKFWAAAPRSRHAADHSYLLPKTISRA